MTNTKQSPEKPARFNDLKIPAWKKLLDSVEQKVAFDGKSSTAPETYRGEQLFQYFRTEASKRLSANSRQILEAGVGAEWRSIVSRILYDAFLVEDQPSIELFKSSIDAHPYFRDLASVAAELELVVTHNFDNALELAIATATGNSRPENRRYNAFWRPDPFLRQNMVNIYHPNGYSPIEGVKGSDSIILTEANFADHLANSNNVEASFLSSHLSSKTWLIIGHSLSDGTLKNALRLHANRRPGHVSYFVHWLAPDEKLTDRQAAAIREANFSTYNLITLFLTSEQISALLRLINKAEEDIRSDISGADLPSRYVYYVCGTVSSGKSTILSHLRSIATVEEWPDRMPATMNKPSTELQATQEDEIDRKLEDAIWRKNEEVSKIKVGLVAVDRAPLDFIAFPNDETETAHQVAKTRYEKVLRRLSRNNFKDLCEGQVIYVTSDVETLLERQIQRGRRPSDEDLESGKTLKYLERQQKLMDEIYKSAIETKKVVNGDCCSIATCLQDVIRIIHFDEYVTFDFSARLNEYIGASP